MTKIPSTNFGPLHICTHMCTYMPTFTWVNKYMNMSTYMQTTLAHPLVVLSRFLCSTYACSHTTARSQELESTDERMLV